MKNIFKNIKEYFKKRNTTIKKLNKLTKKQYETIEEQATDIHFLLEQNNKYKNKMIELERTKKELLKQIRELKRKEEK